MTFEQWWGTEYLGAESDETPADVVNHEMCKEVWEAAAAAARERSLAAVAAVRAQYEHMGYDFYGDFACDEIEKRIREGNP